MTRWHGGQAAEPVRLAGLQDVALLVALQAQCLSIPWSEASVIEALSAQNSFGLVAYADPRSLSLDDGAVAEPATPDALGFILAGITLEEAEIYALGVVDSARQRGIGRKLLAASCEHAERLGAQRLFLEVAESNIAAFSLYTRAGFRRVGRRPNYYRYPNGVTETALILRLDLV